MAEPWVKSWVDGADESLFPLANLPYGVFSGHGVAPRLGVAIGDFVVDVGQTIGPPHADIFGGPSLNPFLAAGPSVWAEVRDQLRTVLSDARAADRVRPHLHRVDGVRLHLPFDVGDYVDFYSSRDHAENLGRILRPGAPPLTPNWLHLPIGYHGRSGTVVVSGSEVIRPSGQRRDDPERPPDFGPSRRLDFEAEVGFVVGVGSGRGAGVPTADFDAHVFGVVLVNDWSARDIQAWEYAPLGPFLGKSFATSISPWVVPLAALDGARVAGPVQDPLPLPYLVRAGDWGLDLTLEVAINGEVVSQPPFAPMYWTPDQQLAHLTVNGASIRAGDLFASGTVSGPGQPGSLIELAANGARPVRFADGSTRAFLEDGDTVTVAATAPAPGAHRIGLGQVTGTVRG